MKYDGDLLPKSVVKIIKGYGFKLGAFNDPAKIRSKIFAFGYLLVIKENTLVISDFEIRCYHQNIDGSIDRKLVGNYKNNKQLKALIEQLLKEYNYECRGIL